MAAWLRRRLSKRCCRRRRPSRHGACVANGQIAIIKPAVDGDYAKPGHAQLLADWQSYRYELTAVPELAGWPVEPQWPAEPDKVI